MSDPTPIKLSESCWCGTGVTVVTWEQARRYVVDWRKTHQHRPGRDADHRGAAVIGFAEPRGHFPAAEANRWGPA